MDEPSELSLAEIRNYMLENGNKVTNHALVKHFRKFLTNPETQNEARKQFKTYVNTLATIKNENNQKYLILRSKYLHECPTEGVIDKIDAPASPGGASIMSEGCGSPFRQPPPYKPPPEVSPVAVKVPILQQETKENYRDCVNEFVAAVNKIDPGRLERKKSEEDEGPPPSVPPRKRSSVDRSISRENSTEENKENVSIGSSESSSKISDGQVQDGENVSKDKEKGLNDSENQISVKEATKKFNRMASEEETKVLSPSSKKKPEKTAQNEKAALEVTIAHPKAKEWIVAGAKADYQDLAKLALEHPELVKLQDPTTGYTALHWAAKHGNEDVVKLIAGTYKADVNARTNGGYTPLHLAMQFGKDNIFELLCNVYKANRDLADWSGNKPLDYRKQRTTVSASTYSKIKARKKQSEKDLGFLRIGSLNVRVKKTTEAFSNFLGVGSGSTSSNTQASHRHHHSRHHAATTTRMNRNRLPAHLRTSAPPKGNQFDKLHKSWGSADNIPHDQGTMPPPTNSSIKKTRSKQSTDNDSAGYSSMPTTPNQLRAPIGILSENPKAESVMDSDSDSACGFGSNWSVTRSGGSDSIGKKAPTYL